MSRSLKYRIVLIISLMGMLVLACININIGNDEPADSAPQETVVEGEESSTVPEPTQSVPAANLATTFGIPQKWSDGVCHQGCYFADVTGDGMVDFIAHDNDGINVVPSTGIGFGPEYSNWTGGSVSCHNECYFADTNGDGMSDFIAYDNDGIWVLPSTGTNFGTPQKWSDGVCHQGCYFADVTGDGMVDFIAHDNDGINVVPSTGIGFGPEYSNWTGGSVSCHNECYFADTNGDGMSDFIAYDNDGIWVLPAQ